MPSSLRRTVAALVFALLASWAWVPVLDAPLARDEFRTLVEARAANTAGGFGKHAYELHGAHGHSLAALDLLRSQALWSDRGSWARAPSAPLRIENLLLVVAAALLLARFVRRALAPWIGSDTARAAGWTSAALFALHPVQPAALASLSARGDLLALVFAFAAGWLFLHGRQKQEPRALGGALACTIAAGACSDVAFALAAWLAIAEYASGKRQRPFQARLRTAATTLLVFGAAVTLDTLARGAMLGRWSPPDVLAGEGLVRAAPIALERIGTLLVPIDASVLGPLGFVLAGAVTLVALQPALSAARSAPRLWGWLLLAWSLALAASECWSRAHRVNTGEFTHAATLIASAAVACIGMGVTATAVLGWRRVLLPLAIAFGYALLGHANATAFRDAALEGASFRDELARSRAEVQAPTLFALDPPGARGGVEVLDGALPWMLDETFVGPEFARSSATVRLASTRALLALAREDEFTALREAGVALLAPRAALGAPSTDSARELVVLPKPHESGPPLVWSGEGRSRALDVEPASTRALDVRASQANTASAPAAAWRAEAAPLELLREGRLAGAWLYGGDAPEAVFDLSSSLAWLCAGRVTQMWSAEGWSRYASAELRGELDGPDAKLWELEPRGKWSFAAGSSEENGTWKLCLLALDSLEYVELDAQLQNYIASGTDPQGERVDVPDAIARAHELARDGSPIAWSLERRIGDVAVERARGRWMRPR